MSSRRNFIKLAGAGVLVSHLPLSGAMAASPAAPAQERFRIGVAGFSFTDYGNDIKKTIEVLKAIRVDNTSLKEFQLPYNSTQAQINNALGQFKDAGITVSALGVIYMRSEKE